MDQRQPIESGSNSIGCSHVGGFLRSLVESRVSCDRVRDIQKAPKLIKTPADSVL